jgi:hypothetical protein
MLAKLALLRLNLLRQMMPRKVPCKASGHDPKSSLRELPIAR